MSSIYGLTIMLIFAGAGCNMSGADVWIYVDNAGTETMIVTLDGTEAATISPGEFAKIGCDAGERRLHVRCGTEVLFDGVKDLKKSDSLGVARRYFFNPDNLNRYRTYTIQYGSNPFEGLSKLLKGNSAVDPENQVRGACAELIAEANLLPSESWFEVPRGAYVLTDLPSFVVTRGHSEKRTALTRVDPKDYALIEAAGKNKNPTVQDLEALEEVVERVLDTED